MSKIAAVVVTYNRIELLLENIRNLLNQKITNENILDIVIIDNASTDGTEERLKIYSEQIKYINTGSNLGGAGGFQFGIKYAVEQNYDYVWIMDDDCMPTESALSEFLVADQRYRGQYGFFSSKVLWKDNSVCKMNVQRKTLTRYIKDFDSEQEIAMASFVSCFVPVSIIREMGLPIKEFFIWTDDWEFTRRISLKYKCYYVPSSVVIHKSVANIGANIATDSADRLERYNYLYRNDVYLYRREGIHGFMYEVVRLSLHIFRIIFNAKDSKLKRISYIFKGTKNGFKFKPEIEFVNPEKSDLYE